jgi:F-box-like
MYPSRTLLDLSTEVLTPIFAYLSAVDLFSVQLTCRRAHDIITGTAYLRYILRSQINSVDDFLPSGFSYSERLELLRRHERSWNNLQYTIFTKFTTSTVHRPDMYTLRDGYLIYHDVSGTELRYGYVDLCSTARDKEPNWVHIVVEDIPPPLPAELIFAVDHDLVVAIRFCVLCRTFLNEASDVAQ